MNSKATYMRRLVIFGIVSLVFLAGCGGSTSQSPVNQPAPPPTAVAVSPSSAPVIADGAQQFTATVSPSRVLQNSLFGTPNAI
jgi:multidrug efflux pump subunit AcrA (membrane-fusion protein)